MTLFRRFNRDRRGVAAVEFALIAPIMVLLYFGLAELCQAMIAERKANHVASAVGDVVAQFQSVTPSTLDDIFTIGNLVMSPFPTSTLQMRVTSITANASAVPKVDWSYGKGGFAALSAGSTVTIPIALTAGDSVVMSESKYQFTSPVQIVVKNALNYSEVYYLRPRRSDQVTCTTC